MCIGPSCSFAYQPFGYIRQTCGRELSPHLDSLSKWLMNLCWLSSRHARIGSGKTSSLRRDLASIRHNFSSTPSHVDKVGAWHRRSLYERILKVFHNRCLLSTPRCGRVVQFQGSVVRGMALVARIRVHIRLSEVIANHVDIAGLSSDCFMVGHLVYSQPA